MPSYFNPLYSYALSSGLSVATPAQVESFIRYPPTISPDGLLPAILGAVAQRMLDGSVQYNGTVRHKWFFGALSAADFSTLITRALGNFTTPYANVTIITKHVPDTYARYNAIVYQPQPAGENNQGDFQRARGGGVINLQLTFAILTNLGDI